MAFATVLALTGLIGRRAGEATIILAAAAFMIQRLASHWRIRGARNDGQAAIGRLRSASAVTATFGDDALSFDMDGRTLNLRYADCEQAEDAGGLIYVWPRNGAPDRRADSSAGGRRGSSASPFPPFGSDRERAASRLSRVNASLLLRRHRGRLGIGRVSRSFGRISSRRRGRRRVQRRQMHIVALRREWWRGGNLLIGIGRRGGDRRRRSVLTTKMQPLLNVLGAPSHTAEHPGLAESASRRPPRSSEPALPREPR